MRTLTLWDAGQESALEGFRADHVMAALVGADTGHALARVWSRPQAALSAGRFHRIDPQATGIERRLSGGRVVPVGPGILGTTLVVPSRAWLAAGGAALRPEQVLNRALRPLLDVVRAAGLDAFYPGRDVVSVTGRTVAYASFCELVDGVVVVEQLLAMGSSFASLGGLLADFDPRGVAGADRSVFDSATSLAELGAPIARDSFLNHLAEHAAERFGCAVERSRPSALPEATTATPAAYAGLQGERGPAPPDVTSAAEITMLGAVEVCARVAEDGRLHDVEISGDVIAPFHTIEELERACEGEVAGGAALGAAVTRVLSDARNFVLGWPDPAQLLTRVAL
jgi:lipoate-protein ligase A